MMSLLAELTERVALLEQLTQGSPGGAEPFIGSELRPDLIGGPTYGSDRSSGPGDRSVKQNLDSPPR